MPLETILVNHTTIFPFSWQIVIETKKVAWMSHIISHVAKMNLALDIKIWTQLKTFRSLSLMVKNIKGFASMGWLYPYQAYMQE